MLAGDLDFRVDYYHEEVAREALNTLVREVFGLDLTPWNRLGVFGEYTPFTLFDGDRAVANVSASPMHLTVAGRRVEAVQIGTVATLPQYRKCGLIRQLINVAHDHFGQNGETSFLFANESVLDFYQQFGYRPVAEQRFSAAAPPCTTPEAPGRLLNLQTADDLALFRRLADSRTAVSNVVGIERHTWLLLFHEILGDPQQLRYIEPLDVVVILARDRETCHLVDVIGARIPTFAELYPYLGTPETRQIEFGFTPDLMGVPDVIAQDASDWHLYVRGPWEAEGPSRFPRTSEA
jgi:GNAT superfamily N-acetyltransferase